MLHAFKVYSSDEHLPRKITVITPTTTTEERKQAAREMLQRIPSMEKSDDDRCRIVTDAHALLDRILSESASFCRRDL